MIVAIALFALLVSTNTCSAAVKGGRIYQPSAFRGVGQPHVHLGKGGGGGALHHTAVVNDPIQGPVLVDKVSSVGGIKSAGLGADLSQVSLSDGPFGRRLYRVGPASYPYGLTGLDYYSYPNSLLTSPRSLRRKTIASPNLSGLRPIGLGSGLRGGILADPTTSQFSIGDAQVKTSLFGGRNLYRSGLSSVPYGLTGLDYYSYPNNLLLQRSLGGGYGLRQTKILGGGSAFTAGDSQIRGPVVVGQSPVASPFGQERVTVVETDPFGRQQLTTVQNAPSVIPQQVSVLGGGLGDEYGQRKVTTTITESADPFAAALGERQITQTVTQGGNGLRGGQIILGSGQGYGGLRRVKTRPALASRPASVVLQETSGLAPAIGGFGQRQVTLTKTAPVGASIVQSPVVAAAPRIVQAPVAPVQILSTPAQAFAAPAPVQFVQTPVQRPFITRRPGEVFLSQVARPQISFARPASSILGGRNVQFGLGGNQLIGGQVASQAPVFAAPRQVVVSQRPAVVNQAPIVGAPRQVVVSQGPSVFSQRPQVISQVKGGVINNNILARRIPQMVYVDGNNKFLGIDIIGGYRVGDPRFGYAQLPYSGAGRFANIGGIPYQSSIEAGPTLLSPPSAPIFSSLRKAPVISVSSPVAKTISQASSPLGYSPITQSAPSVVTQEEVVGPLGDRQVVTTVTKSDPSSVVLSGPSKIGGASFSSPLGFAGFGNTSPAKTITQEQVVGPLGDRQIVTTVSESDSNRLFGSKIGGAAVGSPLGLTSIGQPSTKTISQQEVVGPLGDSQVLTTVTKTEPSGVFAGPSKIGGLATGGFGGIGRVPANTVTQEEVVGPLGDRQIVTTVTKSDSNRLAGSKIGGAYLGSPLGLSAVGQPSTQTITQEEVVGPLGDPQVVTTVTKTEPSSALVSGPSKIGGLAIGGFAGIGQVPSNVITQEEVVGPAGDKQILTTVTNADSNRLVGGKIGGQVVSGPLGLTGVGQGATQTITQEEVVGPLGDSQVVTTVTKTEQGQFSPIAQEQVFSPYAGLRSTSQLSQELAQGPIETVISQSNLASPLSQALVDSLGSGQTHLAYDSFSDPSAVTQVKETTYADPLTGAVNKVTEVSKGDNIVQQNIADTVVQQSISPAFGGGLRFSPRLTFLSQHPYDVPDSGILRSIVTRPLVQQQQELEQILVK